MKEVSISMSAVLTLFFLSSLILSSGCAPRHSPAYDAIIHNDINALKRELDSGVSANHIEEEGRIAPGASLLSLSLQFDNMDAITDLLLQRGADLGLAAPTAYHTEEILSTSFSRYDGVALTNKLLAKGFDPNGKVPDGRSLLHLTCALPESTKTLLAKGARVDDLWVSPTKRVTPLGECLFELYDLQSRIDQYKKYNIGSRQEDLIRRKNLVENILLLVRSGANPNADSFRNQMQSPLIYMAYLAKEPSIVQALVDNGANVLTRQEPTKTTPLHFVAAAGDADLARELINRARVAASNTATANGNPKEADAIFLSWLNQTRYGSGYTALHAAANESGELYSAVTTRATDVISVLIDAGADYTIRDKQGFTAQDHLDRRIREYALAQKAKRESEERAAADARQSEINRQGLLAIVGAVGIAKVTSGKNFTDSQRSGLIDAYVKDRANAANGTQSDNFGQAAGVVKQQLDLAGMAAERKAKIRAEEPRTADAQGVAAEDRGTAAGENARIRTQSIELASIRKQSAPDKSAAGSKPSPPVAPAWKGTKKIVTLKEPIGEGKTEAEARLKADEWWPNFQRDIEMSHERGLAYGRILSRDSTICNENRSWPVGDNRRWGCFISYTKEVLVEDGSAKAMTR